MKTYQVTVNGEVYEVTVEEVAAGTTVQQHVPTPVSPPPQAAAPQVAAPPQPAPKPAPAPTPATPAASGTGGTTIQAPMPGKILSINVAQGDNVKSGNILLILEAMKMENDIMAPVDGKVVSVNVQAGASVNTGDVLAVIE